MNEVKRKRKVYVPPKDKPVLTEEDFKRLMEEGQKIAAEFRERTKNMNRMPSVDSLDHDLFTLKSKVESIERRLKNIEKLLNKDYHEKAED